MGSKEVWLYGREASSRCQDNYRSKKRCQDNLVISGFGYFLLIAGSVIFLIWVCYYFMNRILRLRSLSIQNLWYLRTPILCGDTQSFCFHFFQLQVLRWRNIVRDLPYLDVCFLSQPKIKIKIKNACPLAEDANNAVAEFHS